MHPAAAAHALLLALLLAAVAGGGTHAPPPPGPSERQEAGRALAAELGCGACHAGTPGPETVRARTPALGLEPTLPAAFVFAYLADPTPRRDDIGVSRMPDFRLDEAERVALALLLGEVERGSDEAFAEARGRHPEADAAMGRRIYGVLGCAGCHEGVEGTAPIEGPDLSREGVRVRRGWLTSYLGRPTAIRGDGHPVLGGARMPDFRLTTEEVGALTAWLAGNGAPFAALERASLSPFEAERTRHLLEDRLACLGCHRVDGRGGRIGPSLGGMAERLAPSFVLETILDPQRAAPGSPMPHQPLPAREATRLARWLLDRPATGSAPPRLSLADPSHPAGGSAEAAADTLSGAGLYARHCAACHGQSGGGDGWNAPDLPVPPAAHADAARMGARPDDVLYDGIHAGARVLDGSPRMPAFGALLSPAEIRALVAYIRELCACEAPAWSRDGVRGPGGR